MLSPEQNLVWASLIQILDVYFWKINLQMVFLFFLFLLDFQVTIHPENYFENILNILQHLTRTEQANLGSAVNKTQWNTAPAVVNAYYSRNKNQISKWKP